MTPESYGYSASVAGILESVVSRVPLLPLGLLLIMNPRPQHPALSRVFFRIWTHVIVHDGNKRGQSSWGADLTGVDSKTSKINFPMGLVFSLAMSLPSNMAIPWIGSAVQTATGKNTAHTSLCAQMHIRKGVWHVLHINPL